MVREHKVNVRKELDPEVNLIISIALSFVIYAILPLLVVLFTSKPTTEKKTVVFHSF